MPAEFVIKFSRTILICAVFLVATSHAHEYTVELDASAQRLRVKAHFDQPVTRIRARSRDADHYLLEARDCETGRKLRARGRDLSLPRAGLSCLAYEVDLHKAARDERRNEVLARENFVVSPAAWFWRPSLNSGDEILVRFEGSHEIDVSVPWLPVDGQADTYRLSASPESARAPAAFGNFDYVETDVAGATLRITIMKPYDGLRRDEIVEWVRHTATNVNLAYGLFPNPAPSIVVIPVGDRRWSDSPVPFGRVIRDGGETIELFIDQGKPIVDFYDDWTATHEFSHLMLPYIRSRHRWVSEGFASYYQNILLSRSGQYTERRAWQRLYEGFERGRGSRPEQSPNETAANRSRGGTMKIYWSGAAVALMADVELRQRSGGHESLDSVLRELQRCCLPSERSWSAPELFEKLDSFVDEPVFMPLYRRYANSDGFPDYRATFAALGIDIVDERVRLSERGEGSAIRRDISAERRAGRRTAVVD